MRAELRAGHHGAAVVQGQQGHPDAEAEAVVEHQQRHVVGRQAQQLLVLRQLAREGFVRQHHAFGQPGRARREDHQGRAAQHLAAIGAGCGGLERAELGPRPLTGQQVDAVAAMRLGLDAVDDAGRRASVDWHRDTPGHPAGQEGDEIQRMVGHLDHHRIVLGDACFAEPGCQGARAAQQFAVAQVQVVAAQRQPLSMGHRCALQRESKHVVGHRSAVVSAAKKGCEEGPRSEAAAHSRNAPAKPGLTLRASAWRRARMRPSRMRARRPDRPRAIPR